MLLDHRSGQSAKLEQGQEVVGDLLGLLVQRPHVSLSKDEELLGNSSDTDKCPDVSVPAGYQVLQMISPPPLECPAR